LSKVNTFGLSFDGVDDYVSIPVTLPDNGTIEMWFKPDSLFNFNTLWDSPVGTNDWECWVYSTGVIAARVASNQTLVQYNLNLLYGGALQWFHVAFTWEKTGSTNLYVNGVLRDTKSTVWIAPANTLYVGGGNVGNTKGKGQADEFRIWNTVRTAEEISANIDRQLNGNELGLLAYYKFNDGTGSTAIDTSGSKNGTIFGATWTNDVPELSAYTKVKMEHYVALKDIRQYNTNATFTRASSAIVPTTGATVTNNVTRIVNNGVLVEEGTVNLLASTTAEATFQTSAWNQYLGAVATVTQNQSDPFGGNGATRIQTSGGTNLIKYFRGAGTGTAGTINYTTVWVKNNSATTLRIFTNQGNQSLNVSQNDGWVKFSSQTTSDGFGFRHIEFRTLTVTDNLDFFAYQPQIEAKSYATTFAIGTRSAEMIDIPNATSLLSASTGTVEMLVNMNNTISLVAFDRVLFRMSNTMPNLFFVNVDNNNKVRVVLTANSLTTELYSTTSILHSNDYHIALTWSSSGINLYVNGSLQASSNRVPTFPINSTFFVGANSSSNTLNGVVKNLRLSSRARTATEVLASFQSGLLPDDDTTFMLFPPTYYIQSRTDWNVSNKINFADFNRIESNTSVVRSFAQYLSYVMPSITTVTNRTNTYLEYLSSINRIESNIESIKANAYTPMGYGGGETWTLGKGFDYDDANRIEGNLVKLLLDGEKVFLSYIYSGQVNAGHQRGDLPL
jgi:hypothetical protein